MGGPATGAAALAVLVSLLVAAAVAWAGGQGGARAAGIPVLWWCALAAFAIQWLVFVPAWIARTERFFDLTGSVTYVVVLALALALSGTRDPRAWLLFALVLIWAARLGPFLYRRVRAEGGDRRFDRIKQSTPQFFMTWTLQGLWVFLTAAAALAAITAGPGTPLGPVELAGVLVWLAGFAIEWTADAQKSAFRRRPENAGRFIDTGLWAWSRHPNYFGEITLWIGVAIVAAPTLAGWRWVTLISPLFVIVLLTRISGIPMLERRADKRWGTEPEYEAYKARTPVLVPRPPRSSAR